VILAPPGGVQLREGGHLPSVTIAYAAYGRPWSEAPVVLVCHALTGSARVADWWGDIVGPGKLLDTDAYCIMGTNALGGCYGSTGPSSPDDHGIAWGSRLPVVTVNDMVRMQREALRTLGVARIGAVIGGSLGGMQALEWGAAYPDVVASAIAIGATGRLSPMGIGLNHIGRSAIRLDAKFRGGDYPPDDGPTAGLAIARMVGMLSYKSADLLWQRHAREPNRRVEVPGASVWARYDVQGYLDHQGDKLAARLDANTYLALTKAMDLYEVDATGYRVPTLLVAISSDWLYPPGEVQATAQALGPRAKYVELKSDHGHDGFLADPAALTAIVRPFLSRNA
jgi:homoserine O-acetyltransferase